MRQSLKNLFEDSDPYGTEEQFNNYIKSSNVKAVAVIIACALMCAACFFI